MAPGISERVDALLPSSRNGPYFPSNIYISCCPKPVKMDNRVVDFKQPKTQVGRKKYNFAPGVWRGRAFSKVGEEESGVAFCPGGHVSVHLPLELLAQSMGSSGSPGSLLFPQLWFIQFTWCPKHRAQKSKGYLTEE